MSGKPIDPRLPVLSLLVAASFWGMVWYPLRWLEQQGMSGLWSTLVAYLAACVVVTPFFWRRRAELHQRPLALALLMLSSGWCNVAFVLAVIDGTVMRVLLLFYLSPVWTLILGRWVLGERLAAETPLLVAAAMAGALLMLWDGAIGLPWPQAASDWLALSAGVGFALANVMVRELRRVSVTGKTLVNWVGVILVAVAGVLLRSDTPPVASSPAWGVAALLGISGFLLATFAVQYGVTHLPVQRSAVILLFELVAGGVSSAWWAGETMSPREWLGGGLILVSAYVVARRATED